jgi:nicotinamidase-related amidase
MPLTKLDDTCALIVIDLQKGIAGMPAVPPIAEIVALAADLARAFRRRSMPVVLVNVSGRAPGRTDAETPKLSFPANWTELVPELDRQPGHHTVTKQTMGRVSGHGFRRLLAPARRNPAAQFDAT